MTRKKYDKDFKVNAILQVTEQQQSISRVAQSLGILPTMLSRWRSEYEANGEDAFTENGVPVQNKDLEIKRLQKRLEELEMENQILKKFQAFSKGVEKSSISSSRKTPRDIK